MNKILGFLLTQKKKLRILRKKFNWDAKIEMLTGKQKINTQTDVW